MQDPHDGGWSGGKARERDLGQSPGTGSLGLGVQRLYLLFLQGASEQHTLSQERSYDAKQLTRIFLSEHLVFPKD